MEPQPRAAANSATHAASRNDGLASSHVDAMSEWLQALGFRCEIQQMPSRADKVNLVAVLGEGPGGLVLAGHTHGGQVVLPVVGAIAAQALENEEIRDLTTALGVAPQ